MTCKCQVRPGNGFQNRAFAIFILLNVLKRFVERKDIPAFKAKIMGKGTGHGGQNPKDEASSSGDRDAMLRPQTLGKVTHVGKITMDELKKHRTPGDAWLLVKGKVMTTDRLCR